MLLAAGMAGLLTLADWEYKAKCQLNETPQIHIIPETRDVVYDFSKTSAELTRVKSDTVNPFPQGVRTVTEGLRVDQPKISASVEVSYQMFEKAKAFCMNYKTVDVHIDLSPTIYIASEWTPGVCRDAILTHERRHVDVDHRIVNEIAAKLGAMIVAKVNETGSTGPYPDDQVQNVEAAMNGYIASLINQIEIPFQQEQRDLQAQVDTLEEYQRIGRICHPGT